MRHLSQTSLLRLSSRTELLADRALARGAVVGAGLGFLSAIVSTWGSPRIGSGLLIAMLATMAFVFCVVAAAFLVGGYARFRSRVTQGRTTLAYVGLAIAIAGTSFFAYVAVAGFLGLFLRGSGVRG